MVDKEYKQTDIGIVPQSWDVVKLEPNVGRVKSGKRLPQGYYVTGKRTSHPYLRVIDMNMGYVDTKNIMFVPDEAFPAIQNYCIFKDDIYISVAGTLGLVGRIPEWLDGANLTENANRITNIKCNIDFLMYWLMGDYIKNQIDSTQTVGAQPKLALQKIREFLIPIPSKEEQSAIATALTDIDELIISLKKLIQKKKAIKQGAMQELLTGKKRLPGFSEEWVKINMYNNSKVKARIGWQGLTKAEYLNEGYSYLVTGTDFENGYINWNGCYFVTKERYLQDPNIQLLNGDILITKDGTIGKIALVDGLEKPATLNSGVFVVRPLNMAYNIRFLFYILSSDVFADFLDKLTAGSTIIHLYQKDLASFEFCAPPTVEEQGAIASILYDMDIEIQKLEEKLRKYNKIKQGMMSELLTGKIRFI